MIAAVLLAAAAFAHAAPGRAEGADGGALVQAGRAALWRADGIDAEVKLREALDRGVPRRAVAAYMGEAYLAQDNAEKARVWLGPGEFSPDTAATGFRALARLEQHDGNLPAAGRAFDRALAITPNDAGLWVEIGRLRYVGGEHQLAIDASRHALDLDPRNVRALEFQGELVRDRYGLAAALPWFEAALARAPDDVSVLLQYAATLGDLDRASEAVAVTRRVLQLDGKNPRAYYLQAVLAARAGNYALAKALMNRTRGKLDDVPGTMLLEGVIELAAGNFSVASEELERLLQRQPANARAKLLLARALYLGGEYRYLTRRFSDEIARPDASPYLLTVVARAHEALDERALAGPLLDRAALPPAAPLHPVPDSGPIGALLAEGRASEAEARTERDRAAAPGNFDNQMLAGDVQLMLGRADVAQQRYAAAAMIRMPESLMLRRFQAYLIAGDTRGASELLESYLMENPTSLAALRLTAWLAVQSGDVPRGRAILEYLRARGEERDVQLLSDLALVQVRAGDARAGVETARAASLLQRASPVAAQAFGLGLAALGQDRGNALALLDKARRLMGDSPLLAQARLRLAGAG
ncbi:tetratricopeptide repeat protein [Novosphingobium sp. H3SJ31-1]|uniref:Tetratricopeptide repeat protein n=2 Tax=Novosphingobium album (ex Liu et al. 2023) TaxID=3031130 RepID=A0ABT5WQ03_9SPHN|nr:tetratricopeptide repeat protein [Novosphingobium album (ex Liu et al. 2023)]